VRCIVQISSVSFGFCSFGGVEVARVAAQPAEMTNSDAARKIPNNFFISTPFRSNPAHPGFNEEFTARRGWIGMTGFLQEFFRNKEREAVKREGPIPNLILL
jgi:hypothetical protein